MQATPSLKKGQCAMTCLQVIWIGLISPFSCHPASLYPVFFQTIFPCWWFVSVPMHIPLQTDHLRNFFEKSACFLGLFTTSFAGFSFCRTGLEAIMETYAFWRPPVRTLTFEDFTTMQKQQGKAPGRASAQSECGGGGGSWTEYSTPAPSQATSSTDFPGTGSTR